MGKVAPEPVVSQRTHSGRSYWVRNILASARDNTPEPSPPAKGSSKSPTTRKRFVEPYRLSDEQRAAMLAPLAERGIGDPESRELFAAALAYDLATCYELTVVNADQPDAQALYEVAERPTGRAPARSQTRKAAPGTDPDSAQAAADPALVELAEAARSLTRRLEALGRRGTRQPPARAACGRSLPSRLRRRIPLRPE
jgi:hypothetical protein